MKKTAVEWLLEMQLKPLSQWPNNIHEIAKEIEKQQIMDAYEIGFADAWDDARYDDSPTYEGAEQYYNETYNQNNMDDKTLKITFTEYGYSCGDGCCYNSGVITKINEVELPLQNENTETIVKQILEHLGYTVEVEYL